MAAKTRINKVLSGGDLHANLTTYGKTKVGCGFNPNMSWVDNGGFCMKKPASTLINTANIPQDTINTYISQSFEYTPDRQDEPELEELARNFHRTIPSFYMSIKGADSPYSSDVTVEGTTLTTQVANELVTELGGKVASYTGDKRSNKVHESVATKIMRSVDTTGSPMLWNFPLELQTNTQTFGGAPSLGETRCVCMVGDGYVFQFVYYYMPIGDLTIKGEPGRKHSDFVVRGYTKNLYLDENDYTSAIMQIFPTDISDIDTIVTDDKDFRALISSSSLAAMVAPSGTTKFSRMKAAKPGESVSGQEQVKETDPQTAGPVDAHLMLEAMREHDTVADPTGPWQQRGHLGGGSRKSKRKRRRRAQVRKTRKVRQTKGKKKGGGKKKRTIRKSKAKSGTSAYFEFKSGSSRKFWRIVKNGSKLTTHYGKLGTLGQMTTKDYGSNVDQEYDTLIQSKKKKGYVEKTDFGNPNPKKPTAIEREYMKICNKAERSKVLNPNQINSDCGAMLDQGESELKWMTEWNKDALKKGDFDWDKYTEHNKSRRKKKFIY